MNEPNDKDPALKKVLTTWKVSASLPPRFQEQVWNRIARAELTPKAPVWVFGMEWLDKTLPRPAIAASYVTVLVLTGLLAGLWQAGEQTARLDNELGLRYVQTVDPYQAPRH